MMSRVIDIKLAFTVLDEYADDCTTFIEDGEEAWGRCKVQVQVLIFGG